MRKVLGTGIVLATALAALAASCSRPQATLIPAAEIARDGLGPDLGEGKGRALGDMAGTAASLAPARSPALPLPSSYAEMAGSLGFVADPPDGPGLGRAFPTIEQTALALGARGADCCFLVFADPDDPRLGAAADDLPALAKLLGVSEKLAVSIASMARELKRAKGTAKRALLDEMTLKVDAELRGAGLDELSLLLSLGGWIETLDILSASLARPRNAGAAVGSTGGGATEAASGGRAIPSDSLRDKVARDVVAAPEILEAYLDSMEALFPERPDPASPVGIMAELLRGSVAAQFAALGSVRADVAKALADLNEATSAMKAAISKGGR